MERPELERLQGDLTVIREAAGIELPFGWEDVWTGFAIGVLGGIAFAWGALVRQWPAHWGFVPMIVLVVPYAIWVRIRYRRSTARSVVRRREYTAGLVLIPVALVVAVIYRVWARHLGLPMGTVQAIAILGGGCAVLLPAILDARRVSLLPYAVALILAGLVMPWVRIPGPAVVGLGIAVAGPVGSLIQIYQLRNAVRHYAAD
jgi:hypothetical protein